MSDSTKCAVGDPVEDSAGVTAGSEEEVRGDGGLDSSALPSSY